MRKPAGPPSGLALTSMEGGSSGCRAKTGALTLEADFGGGGGVWRAVTRKPAASEGAGLGLRVPEAPEGSSKRRQIQPARPRPAMAAIPQKKAFQRRS